MAVRAKSRVDGRMGAVPLVVGAVLLLDGGDAVFVAEAEGAGLEEPPMPLEFGAAKTMSFEVWAEARPRRTGVAGELVDGLGRGMRASRARGRKAKLDACECEVER